MEHIEYGSQTLEFDLSFGERKNMVIEVYPDKTVLVKAPNGTARPDINKRILKRARWIIRQQKYFDQFLPRTPQREYVPGESHSYLGNKYLLRISSGPGKEVKLKNGQLSIVTPDSSPTAVKALVASWYYNHAVVKFQQVFNESSQLFRRYDIGTPRMEIRRMKNRWGSCTPSGKVIMNPELIKAPKRCIEYVVIHELCHLIEPNHSKRYYGLLDEVMPEWRRWKKRLESTMA